MASRNGSGKRPAASPRPSAPSPASAPSAPSASAGRYAGDYTGRVDPVYAPKPDGAPDPGEVVWAWVPYEDDPAQGKDRPVLLIGRSGTRLLGLMLTSRDRNNSGVSDPDYIDIGTGAWDSKGRPSEVKLNRILTLEPSAIRRQGAVVDREVFNRVAKSLSARRR
ncbi:MULTISPECIES: type II toxin-antitoxin system PemK/MazF family toxin [Arthrobacter]|uniref:type II toxin-antitoxin system PemK/MazF family toxin n=1 Tax=Arthrobacter TaxID=1663 RepID=UPI001E4A24A8|nr:MULTISPECIES: type II toxin-antitoxin system PemK/MazF family toxin [unclassified Arthrobacter]